jgi:HCOMODA/2-hydroxy-3-carboxy-muconic semialdehyde decarboxylase
MADLDALINELVLANRILAGQGVVDAFGHVSVRHPEKPDRFFLSRSRSPELVEHEDIMEFGMDGQVTDGRTDPAYHERFIHAAVYEANPEINAVVHSHALDVLPFTISSVPLQPCIHTASQCGGSSSL